MNKKREVSSESPSPDVIGAIPHTRSAAEQLAAGKSLRGKVLRQAHGEWKRPAGRADPLAILRASDAGRLEQLVPIRYGRMLQTPFTFYRGAAAVMAADLAKTPATGIRVQACGDCHLLNFGGFATPERNILFDINDFDETLPAPWEWDMKRLGGLVRAGRPEQWLVRFRRPRRGNLLRAKLSRAHARILGDEPARGLVRTYRSTKDFLGLVPNARVEGPAAEADCQGQEQPGSELAYPKLAGMVGGRIRIQDTPPLIFHPEDAQANDFHELLEESLADYREILD